MIWGRRWRIVLLPILTLTAATGNMSDPIYPFVY